MLAFEVVRCPIDGTIVSVWSGDGPVPPCPTCALKAEFEAKLKALEERSHPVVPPPPRRERDF